MMRHALIIEENRSVGKLLEERLVRFGFRSFTHVWTEDDAVEAARLRSPDLVLVGDSVAAGSAVHAARRICEQHGVPALLVTGDSQKVRRSLPADAHIGGPFLLRDMGAAVRQCEAAIS